MNWGRFNTSLGPSLEVAADAAASSTPLLKDLDRRYRQPLVRYFEKRLRDSYDVDDMVQEVFLRLTHRSQLDNIEFLDGYVFQVAANVIHDRLRRQMVRRAASHCSLDDAGNDLPEITDDFSPERVLTSRQLLDRVIAALEMLPLRTRQVFVLAQFEDMNYEEIATQLGLSVSGVRFLLRKAKAELTLRMEQDV